MKTPPLALVVILATGSLSAQAQDFEWKGTACKTINSCFDRRNQDYLHNSRMMRNEFKNRVYGRNSYRWDRELGRDRRPSVVHRIPRTTPRVGGSGSKYKWGRTQ